MKTRIGILTGGGDCPGLNAVIRAVVKSAAKRDWETLGILGGFEGLLRPTHSRVLDYHQMDGLLYLGGTVLGTSNKGQFSGKSGHGETRTIDPAVLAEARAGFESLGLRALVVVGGDGSLTIAQQIFEAGIPVVGVPKTIDNDIEGTVVTFGFDSAVAFAPMPSTGCALLRRATIASWSAKSWGVTRVGSRRTRASRAGPM